MSGDLASLAFLADHELMARLAAGDEAALGAVYDRHVDVVYGSVLRFLGDRQAAEEVVQDAFLAVWREARRFDAAAGSLPGWLLRIARNRAIDRLRAAARRPQLLHFPDEDDRSPARSDRSGPDGPLAQSSSETFGPSPVESPEEALDREWSRVVVRTALSAMPEPERRALELAYDEELSQAEIAERLGWPLGTVKSRTRRALAGLRMALEGVPGLAPPAARPSTLTPVMDSGSAPPAAIHQPPMRVDGLEPPRMPPGAGQPSGGPDAAR